MSNYNLPGYGTVGESILLDAPGSDFTASDLANGLAIDSAKLGSTLSQFTERGFVEIVDEHNHGNTYRLTELGKEAQEELLNKYGLQKINLLANNGE